MTRQLGQVAEWQDSRGFGFITPHGGTARLFFHIRDYHQAGRRPEAGEWVQFVAGQGSDGRACARKVQRVAQRRPGAVRRAAASGSAWTAGWPLAWLVMGLYAGLLAWSLWAARIPAWLPAGIGLLSLATACAYGLDKRAARAGHRRTPERVLQLLALAGGWPGALIAQRLLRHKTRKTTFQAVFWLMVAFNVVAIVTWPDWAG